MNQKFIIVLYLLKSVIFYSVETNEIHIYNPQERAERNYTDSHQLMDVMQTKNQCLFSRKSKECSHKLNSGADSNIENVLKNNTRSLHKRNIFNRFLTEVQPIFRRSFMANSHDVINLLQHKIYPSNMMLPIQRTRFSVVKFPTSFRRSNHYKPLFSPKIPLDGLKTSYDTRLASLNKLSKSTQTIGVTESTQPYEIMPLYERFARSLDNFERKFYMISFKKLTSISPRERQTNGISFVQSGFLLQLTLMALSLEVDQLTKNEIDTAIGFKVSNKATLFIIKELMSSLTNSSKKLKFRCASQLTMWPGTKLSKNFRGETADALALVIDSFNGTEKSLQIMQVLNQQVEKLSGGALRNTFEEEDVSDGVTAVLMTILYFRVNWRSPPTVLNGTRLFRDTGDARAVRMIKLNDIMGYVDLKEWNAQALEISYSYPDLSFVILLPRSSTLRQLADNIITTSIIDITRRMRRMRIAATLPLYTLRMTLLLPNKLQAMGVSRLFNASNVRPGESLRLSHMVQRLMFWAEAGRNAYKDDGLDWDEKPEMEILVDRPYIFYVRWRNLTLLNGNFVL